MGCVLNQILSSSLGPFALCLRAALGLFVLCGEGASAHADHLSPKHDPWAQPWELERLALLKVPEDMVPVPGGPFLMGSDPKVDRAAGPQEQPQRPVLLDAFEIDRYEITNVHYLRFVFGYWCGLAAVLDAGSISREDGVASGHRGELGRSQCLLSMGGETASDRSGMGKSRAR